MRLQINCQIVQAPLTAQDIREVVNSVHQSKALERINQNPENVTLEDLNEATSIWIDSRLFSYYKQAIVNEWRDTQKAFSLERLKEIINEVKNNIQTQALADINANPLGFTYETLQLLSVGGEQKYLDQYRTEVKNLKDSITGDLTIEDIRTVIQNVHEAEALKNINQNPTSFEEDDFIECYTLWRS